MSLQPNTNQVLWTANLMPKKDVGSPVQMCTDPHLKCAIPYRLVDPEDKGERKAKDFIIELAPASLAGGDSVTVKGTGACSCAGATVTVGEKRSALNAPVKISAWTMGLDEFELINRLGRVTPRQQEVQVICGLDQSTIHSGEIRVYPSDKIKIKVESSELIKKCPNVAKALDDLMHALSTITGHKYDPTEGIHIPTTAGDIAIEPPKLSMEYEAQWKEYQCGSKDEWEVYYNWKLTLTICLSAKLKIDILGAVVTCTGVGAPVVAFAQRVQDWIGQKDPIVCLEIGAEISGGGKCGYEDKLYGAVTGQAAGKVALSAGLNIKGKIKAYIQASTGLSGTLDGKPALFGMELEYELLKWEGLKGEACLELDTGFFSIGYEDSVQLLDEAGPLWKGSI